MFVNLSLELKINKEKLDADERRFNGLAQIISNQLSADCYHF